MYMPNSADETSGAPDGLAPILVYRLGSLGDTIVALPCFHAILKRFPRQPKIALTNFPVSSVAAPLESVLGPGGFVQGAISYPVGTRSPRQLLALRKKIRSTGAKTLVYLASTRSRFAPIRDFLFFRLCGIRNVLCVPLSRDLLHNRVDDEGIVEREAERLARCVEREFQVDVASPSNWDLRLTHTELQRVAELKGTLGTCEYFIVNMGGKAAEKDWGAANWTDLISRIRFTLEGHTLVVVGATEDRTRGDQLIDAWGGKGLNLCGDLTPRETYGVMKNARFFIGHDSGPMHLAAAAQVRCVGIFGSFNAPMKWHPPGQGHIIIHEMRGIASITVERVLDAVARVALRNSHRLDALEYV
jgi:heptosyltransferase III